MDKKSPLSRPGSPDLKARTYQCGANGDTELAVSVKENQIEAQRIGVDLERGAAALHPL